MRLQCRNDAVFEGAVEVDAVCDDTDSVGAVISVAAAPARDAIEALRVALSVSYPHSRTRITVDGVGAEREELVVGGVVGCRVPVAALYTLGGGTVGAEPCRNTGNTQRHPDAVFQYSTGVMCSSRTPSEGEQHHLPGGGPDAPV